MKVRWAIERGPADEPDGSVWLALVDQNGENIGSATIYYSEDAAKNIAQKSSEQDEPLVWKAAPEAWQPDTYLVSNYYEDEGWER